MDKNLLSSILVAAVFLLGATVQFIRGRTVFAVIPWSVLTQFC